MKIVPKELQMGMKEETKEHSKTVNGSERKIREIVMAHLKEDSHYYSKISKVIKS
jgi:hypothetical protein